MLYGMYAFKNITFLNYSYLGTTCNTHFFVISGTFHMLCLKTDNIIVERRGK